MHFDDNITTSTAPNGAVTTAVYDSLWSQGWRSSSASVAPIILRWRDKGATSEGCR